MRHLRMLGLMLLAALALGAYAAAMASAEAGLLTLSGKSETIEVKGGEGKEPVFKAGSNEYRCTKLKALTTSATGAHVNLFKEVPLAFEGCKLAGEVSCRSETLKAEKDPLGTILMLGDFHVVELESATKVLEAGLAVILLDPNTKEVGVVKIKCGTGNIELKGTIKGVISGASKNEDVATGSFVFGGSNKCATTDTLCKTLEASPFLINLSGTYEPVTLTVTVPFTTNIMALVDY